jgi:predicted transcriptional regulator
MSPRVADVHFQLDAYLHRRLQDIARQKDRSISSIMREAALLFAESQHSVTKSVDLEGITNAARASTRRKP